MRYQVQKSTTAPGAVPALATSRMLSSRLSAPPHQWSGSLCGATRSVGSPSKVKEKNFPMLRKVSYETPKGRAVCPGTRGWFAHFDSGIRPKYCPRLFQKVLLAMSTV